MTDTYVDKGLAAIGPEMEDELPADVDVDVSEEMEGDESGITMEEDGSVVIDFDAGGKLSEANVDDIPFNANLAQYIAQEDLNKLGSDICQKVYLDDQSRSAWTERYTNGLKLLGINPEKRTEPWPDACGVFHPVMTEAIIRFQAQAIMELFPPKGPVNTSIVGKITPEREDQANRIKQDMNWICCHLMKGYREDTEQLLLNLPVIGSGFRKITGDPRLQRPSADFVPAEDFIVAFNARSLTKAERYTHRFKITPNELTRKQAKGVYLDIELTPTYEKSEVTEEKDKIQGTDEIPQEEDDLTLYETHVVYDLPEPFASEDGVGKPYIITMDKGSTKVLSVYRNWKEDDPEAERRQWFVDYKFLPGLGFYGWGLIHIIGGLTEASTSLLRQLVDAGELSNLPAGYKTKGARVAGNNDPLAPGEWRDVDVVYGKLSESFFPLPYKEPSATLFQLLQNLIEEARRLGAVADMKISDMSAQAPVGTTFALLEGALKIQSAVQARLHNSMKEELGILVEIIREDMPPNYPFDVDGEFTRAEDYDGRVDVIPVSDPNASTTAQRILQNQAAIQLSETSPEIYDKRILHRSMLRSMGMDNADQLIPPQEKVVPLDPVTENMNLLNGTPVTAGLEQDQDAHIAIHKALLDDPMIGEMVQNTPQGPKIAAATAAHILEHLAMKYRKDIERELGVPLPPLGEPLPPDIESQLSSLVAEAADKVLGRAKAEAQRADLLAKMEDPVIQNERRKLDNEEAKVREKARVDNARIDLDRDKVIADLVKFFLELQASVDEEERRAVYDNADLAIKVAAVIDKSTNTN